MANVISFAMYIYIFYIVVTPGTRHLKELGEKLPKNQEPQVLVLMYLNNILPMKISL